MALGAEVANAVIATDKDAQYDQNAKSLLGNKIILAHILVKTVDEFKGMNPKNVVSYIEGEPYISVVPIELGLTNAEKEENGQHIVGMNTENSEVNEGLIRFDIIFYVRMKDGLSQMIVNVECQKDLPTEYHILNRAIFYVSRLVSSQKERDFTNSQYDDIKRVYSIWVCLNMNQNSMNYVHMTNDALIGSYKWKGKIDLLNIVLIGITDELPEHDETYELHRLLGTLLSKHLEADEKLSIMEKEYQIPAEEEIRRKVRSMCNLSQGIREDATAERDEEIIMNMHSKGCKPDLIADYLDRSVEEIESVIERKEKMPALV